MLASNLSIFARIVRVALAGGVRLRFNLIGCHPQLINAKAIATQSALEMLLLVAGWCGGGGGCGGGSGAKIPYLNSIYRLLMDTSS